MRVLANLLYYFLWLIGLFVYLLPFVVKKGLANILAQIWFHLIPFRKKIILLNLSVVFPRKDQESMGEFRLRCENLAQANMKHMVLGFFEVLERFHWSKELMGRRFHVDGREHLDKALREHAGCFLLTSHLGNWELMSCIGVLIEVPLAIITKFLRNPFFDQIWVKSRQAYGLELIQERGTGLQIVKAIRKGRAVGFIADQHTGAPHGLESQFLGMTAWTPKALTILAAKLKCPIIPTYMFRKKDGSFQVIIEEELKCQFPEAKLSTWQIQEHLLLINQNMEKWILKYPEQYLWIHRRFKRVINYKRDQLPWE